MEIKGYIFDLDGTLLDTLPDLTKAMNETLRKNGEKRISEEKVRQYIGNGIKKLVSRAMPKIKDESELDKNVEYFKKYYVEHCMNNTKIYAGIEEVLNQIIKNKKQIGVASNKADIAVKKLVKYYFPGYEIIAQGENEKEGIKRKPDIDILEKVLKKMQVTKEEVIYIGDSEVDIETARNAGIKCISVSWGYKSKEFLKRNGGKEIIDKPVDMLKYVN